jgi:hypothetical protein
LSEILDDTTLANRALARIGGGRITSLEDESDLAAQVRGVYADTLALALAAYRWRWNRRTKALSLADITPENGWKYAHHFPAGWMGGPEKVLINPRNPDNPLREFAVEGPLLCCDHTPVWAVFPMQISPDQWPPLFTTAFTVMLAGFLCMPVSHDRALQAELLALAGGSPSEFPRGGLMGRAIAMDAQADGGDAPLLASDPITGARNDGPWHGDY